MTDRTEEGETRQRHPDDTDSPGYETTPLVFSPCSTPGSLDSVSTPGDLSSVYSEDSPGRVAPADVFADRFTLFDEEGTPAGRSQGSSLSALTFDLAGEDEEDDEVVLAACIGAGMRAPRENRDAGPLGGTQCRDPGVCEDALVTFHVEGTPADLSHSGSPLPSHGSVRLSDVSDESDDILAECIRSGMPPARAP